MGNSYCYYHLLHKYLNNLKSLFDGILGMTQDLVDPKPVVKFTGTKRNVKYIKSNFQKKFMTTVWINKP